MSRKCEICGKGPQIGHNVSHAMNKTRKVWLPNLQRVRVSSAQGAKGSTSAPSDQVRQGGETLGLIAGRTYQAIVRFQGFHIHDQDDA